MLTATATHAESTPVTIPEPAPIERLMGKDVQGWVEHLKSRENEVERKKAMLCLMDFGSAAGDAVPELRTLMKDELQIETQRFAIITLGAIGAPAKVAMPDLMAALSDPARPASHKAAALASMAQIEPESPAVRKTILAALRDGNAEVRAEALDAAITIYPNEQAQVIAALSRALITPPDAAAAATALRCIGEPGVDVLLKTLDRAEPATRIVIAESLGRMGSDGGRALQPLIKNAKRERNMEVRSALTLAAARIAPKNPEVLDLVADGLLSPPMPPDEDNPRRQPYEHETRILGAAGTAALPALAKALRARDAAARLLAVGLLAKINPPTDDVIQELIARAQDKDNAVSLAAIKALDTFGPAAAKAAEPLREIARAVAHDETLRRAAELAAVNVAREAGSPRHRTVYDDRTGEELVKLLKDASPATRQQAAEALLANKDAPVSDEGGEVAAALIEALNDADEKVRIAAARSLVRFGKHSRVVLPKFVEWLEGDNLGLRKAALAALAGMAADAKPALTAAVATAVAPVADEDKELQKLLAIVLRMIGPDAATPLVEQMKTPDAEIRARAARALASMREVGATAIPDLIEMTKSAVDTDAQAGFAGLQAMGPVAYHVAAPHLVSVLRGDVFAERRKWATWALGEIKVPPEGDNHKVIDALMEALLDLDDAVCRGAHGALVRIGEPALPKLRDMMKLGEGEAPYWAVRVLARMKADPSEVIPKLAELTLPGKRPVERGTAAELLGEYAPAHPEIIPVLLRVVGDREDFVSRAAVRSLALFGESAIPPVKNLLRQQRNPLLRKRALEALEGIRVRLESTQN